MACPELPFGETLAFVERFLPRERARILDVGCGRGALARRLSELGHRVSGVEPDPECVRVARASGVDAHAASFPSGDLSALGALRFDALVFSRTLHHIDPLEAGLERAAELLVAGGRIIVEDFAFTDVTARDVRWLHAELVRASEAAELDVSVSSFASRVWKTNGSPAVLDSDPDHAHELRSAADMLRTIAERFELLHTESVPYYFRYLSQVAPEGDVGCALVRELLNRERRSIQAGQVAALGRRYVARLS